MVLRVGVNALYLIPGGVGGTELYLRGLLAALAGRAGDTEYWIFRNRESGPDLIPPDPRFHDCPQGVRATFRPSRILWEQLALPQQTRKLRLDVLFNAGFTAPLLAACPMVTMFYDLQYKKHPEYFRWFDLPVWQTLLPASARRSRALVAMSEAAKADLEHYFPFARGRIAVVPHGVEAEFACIERDRSASPPTEPLLLTVSTLHPHKNLDRLLEAFARFRRRRPEFRLIVAGLKGFESDKLHRLRDSLGLAGHAEFTGWIPREKLYDLFRRAHAFVYPSRFEGFGIPVLEALTAGIPTACSRIPTLQEIAGSAAVWFDPDDLQSLDGALEAVTSDCDLRERLSREGTLRATRYSWAASAEILHGVLARVAHGNDPISEERAARS